MFTEDENPLPLLIVFNLSCSCRPVLLRPDSAPRDIHPKALRKRSSEKWLRRAKLNKQRRWKQKTALALPREEGRLGAGDLQSLKSQNSKVLQMKIAGGPGPRGTSGTGRVRQRAETSGLGRVIFSWDCSEKNSSGISY